MKSSRIRIVVLCFLFLTACVGLIIQHVWFQPSDMPITVVYAEQPRAQANVTNAIEREEQTETSPAVPHADALCTPNEDKNEQRIDVNNASAEQLTSLPGIGPAYAERIIALRKQRNGFIFKEELLDVSGIGQARYANLEPLICLNPYQADTDA